MKVDDDVTPYTWQRDKSEKGVEDDNDNEIDHDNNDNKIRPASGVLSNIDHQKKNPNIDQISTTQHFIDQISTAKVP